jgi:hypothetical protein
MKKILIALIIFIPNIISAKEYYGDFKYIETKDVFEESTNIRMVNPFNKYKYYFNQEKGQYLEMDLQNEYNYQDLDNYIYDEYGEWQNIFLDKEEDLYQEREVYEYKELKPIRYIHFFNLKGSNGGFRITELDIMYQGKEIGFNYYCEGCSTYFDQGINNQKANENLSVIFNGGYLRLDLGSYYKLEDIIIKMYLYDVTNESKNYSIAFSREEELNKHYYSQTWVDFFKNKDLDDLVLRTITPFGMIPHKLEYDHEVLLEGAPPNNTLGSVVNQTQYRYRHKFYYFYNIEKTYSEDYLTEPNEIYTLKGDQYKEYYDIYERDYLFIEEELTLEKDQLIENKIITNGEYLIEHNIDYDKNGEYLIKIYFNEQTIETKVIIDHNPEENIINNEEPTRTTKETPKQEKTINIVEKLEPTEIIFEEKAEPTEKKEFNIETEKQVDNIIKKSSFEYKNILPIFILIILIIFRKMKKKNNI